MKNSLSLQSLGLAGIFLILCGCSAGPEAKLIGKWKGSPPTGLDPRIASLMGNPTVEFAKDKTFKQEFSILGRTATMEGTWTISGNSVSMTIAKVDGKSIEEAKAQAKAAIKDPALQKKMDENGGVEAGTLSSDGKTLSVNNAKGSGAGITYTKEPSTS
ncbi:MAG TPA: hypothetical protein VG944_08645 [Fimbriimonas sp.]|nr:hypothetical protein [Fimbriimonas sp.]